MSEPVLCLEPVLYYNSVVLLVTGKIGFTGINICHFYVRLYIVLYINNILYNTTYLTNTDLHYGGYVCRIDTLTCSIG